MFIMGIGTAVPPGKFTQQQCWETARSAPQIRQLSPRAQALLRKILLGDSGIESRFLALDSLTDILELDPEAMHARFARHAPALGVEAARKALERAGTTPSELDAVLVTTCTGYLCPGLTSYISEALALRSDILLLDLVGQGCGAALPNFRTAEALLKSGRAGRVLSVAVEVCSAAFYLDNDPGVLVSACLFGDGAAAAVLALEPLGSGRRVEWKEGFSLLAPEHRNQLRFEQKGGLLRNILDRQVPELAGKHASFVLEQGLAGGGLQRDQITAWILHPGGRNVLCALGQWLRLSDQDLRWSAAVLKDHGNQSSPSVLFVLQSALAGGAPGGYWWMSTFGAGFSCHGALLEVE